MMRASRAHIASSFTLIKGAMVDETYATFAKWDLSRSNRENLDRLRSENFVGARSTTWLRDVAKVLNRRFDPNGRDRPLVLLARNGCSVHVWKPLLLWHMTRDEFLLRDFLLNWLYPAYASGAFRVRPQELYGYLRDIAERGATTEHVWSDATTERVAAGLLKMAVDFDLLHGRVVKEFAAYHLPEQSFLYLLHAIRDATPNPRKVIDAADWRLFLVNPDAVERELLRLHQYRKLDYQVAGSLVQLRLPCASSREYAERMVA
jgi:hypothetical protein